MSNVLHFDLVAQRGRFTLDAAAEIPMTGITVLSGPSGSGKTTLLRALAGLETSVTGTVRFADQDWSRRPAAERGIGYVFQDAQLFPHLSVAENLEYGARRRGASTQLVRDVIEALDLTPLLARAPATLSGGEARRVGLGRALASQPNLLLLDEPLTGLDRARKSALMPYIARAVAGFDVPALYVTHSAHEISFLADRTMFIEAGQLTGWSGATPRLIGQVVNAAPGEVNLVIGRYSMWVEGQGRVGETWALPIGQDAVLSLQDPGVSSAALVLAGRAVRAEPGGGACHVDIEGQHISLNWPRSDGIVPTQGAPIWVSLPQAAAKPIQAEPRVESGSG